MGREIGTCLACAILYYHLWPVWFYHIFTHYLINGTCGSTVALNLVFFCVATALSWILSFLVMWSLLCSKSTSVISRIIELIVLYCVCVKAWPKCICFCFVYFHSNPPRPGTLMYARTARPYYNNPRACSTTKWGGSGAKWRCDITKRNADIFFLKLFL
jgi:hypothetical protein